jgi:hypothetical protein
MHPQFARSSTPLPVLRLLPFCRLRLLNCNLQPFVLQESLELGLPYRPIPPPRLRYSIPAIFSLDSLLGFHTFRPFLESDYHHLFHASLHPFQLGFHVHGPITCWKLDLRPLHPFLRPLAASCGLFTSFCGLLRPLHTATQSTTHGYSRHSSGTHRKSYEAGPKHP